MIAPFPAERPPATPGTDPRLDGASSPRWTVGCPLNMPAREEPDVVTVVCEAIGTGTAAARTPDDLYGITCTAPGDHAPGIVLIDSPGPFPPGPRGQVL
jgi:hypothetical protein